MSLLNEIDTTVRLRPLADLFEQLDELGIDANDDDVYLHVDAVFRNILGLDDDQELEEGNTRSEYSAGQAMMQGRGVNMDQERKDRLQRVRRSQLDNPRLGLQSNDPKQGDMVKMSGGAGVGKVVGMKGDEVFIQNKSGYKISTPRHTLRAKAVRHPRSGENMVVWIEEIY